MMNNILSKSMLTGAVLMATQSLVSANEMTPLPLTSVADVDASGRVTKEDTKLIKNKVKAKKYISLYDINADGALNDADIELADSQIGQYSTLLDQEIATFFQRFEHLQGMTGAQFQTFDYNMAFTSLAGHGAHWINTVGFASVLPGGMPNYNQAQGLNLPADGSEAKAMFYGAGAYPVFMDRPADEFFAAIDTGTPWYTMVTQSDFPAPGGEWQDLRVAAFYEGPDPQGTGAIHPPKAFEGAPTMMQAMQDGTDMRLAEMWHTHAGLCLTVQIGESGPYPSISQHTTFNECQAKPNLAQQPIGQNPVTGEVVMGNAWLNIWMMHLWFFDLNPNGLFAGTHPDIDPCGVSEDTINDGKRVPPYFHMSDNHPDELCEESQH